VVVTVLLALVLGALVNFGASLMSNLTVVRPFFF
jgi:hypothetical protein